MDLDLLTQRLQAAWARSDDLFARLPELQARPIHLRHPFVFYLGHLPAFAWNQLAVSVLGRAPTGPFDQLFAFGIDPDSAAQASEQSIAAYPPLDEIVAYRDQVRADLLTLLPELHAGDTVLHRRGRGVNLVIEHELMHHETLLYMIQHGELAIGDAGWEGGDGEAAEEVEVPAGEGLIGADFDALAFGWDNEFPARRVPVPAFRIDSLPVRNADWQAFVAAGGPRPLSWVDGRVRTVVGDVPLAEVRGWPVQVSQEQAAAYAEWKGRRLPTEAELARVRHQPADANVDFARWAPRPVGHAGASPSGVREVVGNGWELTSTVWQRYDGFHPYVATYDGYSADFFDDQHMVVVGGSWATDAALLRPSFRNWYRADYPYVFSKFRTVAR